MSRRYRLTELAARQRDDIAAFIAEHQSVNVALRFYDALEAALEQLAEFPGLGHVREDLTDRPLKFWSVWSYLVVYDPQSQPLTIHTVAHGARDVTALLEDDV